MPKLLRVTARELLAALRRDGWYVLRQDGSHLRLAHPHRANKVTVAVHAGAIVKAGTLKGILEQAGMSVERLIDLLTYCRSARMARYTVLLVPDPEEGGYSVSVPALPGLFTQGDTYQEAITNARQTIAFHLDCLRAEGEPVPDETTTPELVSVSV